LWWWWWWRVFRYTPARYSACPTIRFDGTYFYLLTLFAGVPNGTEPSSGNGYPCCFVEWLVRSTDLSVWTEASANPVLGWPGPQDRVIMPGSLLDTLGTPEDKALARGETDDINRSDIDFVFVPWLAATYVIFFTGNQVRNGAANGRGGEAIVVVVVFVFILPPPLKPPSVLSRGSRCRQTHPWDVLRWP
jgi:hypothetical protein